jgi:NADPH:quinone reductase-like Zn-dependent oxidoreductase
VALTAAQSIWYRLGLDAPFDYNGDHQKSESKGPETINFFIYGATTSVGLYAAKMLNLSARASGKKIRLFGAAQRGKWGNLLLAPYSIEHLVDYREQGQILLEPQKFRPEGQSDVKMNQPINRAPYWPEQVQKLSEGAGMDYAYDCISEGETVQQVASTLNLHGKLAIVRSRAGGAWKADNLPVEPIYGAVWEGLGKEVQYQGFTVQESPAARAFAVAFYKWLSSAAGSALELNRIRLMPGGLEKVVEDGFQLLGTGSMADRKINRTEEWMRPVSAEKLVYEL